MKRQFGAGFQGVGQTTGGQGNERGKCTFHRDEGKRRRGGPGAFGRGGDIGNVSENCRGPEKYLKKLVNFTEQIETAILK